MNREHEHPKSPMSTTPSITYATLGLRRSIVMLKSVIAC
jgi:hypothetical protein